MLLNDCAGPDGFLRKLHCSTHVGSGACGSTEYPGLDRANCLKRTSEPQLAACSGMRELACHGCHGLAAQEVVNRNRTEDDVVWSDESPITRDK